jgi:hypothetical protein
MFEKHSAPNVPKKRKLSDTEERNNSPPSLRQQPLDASTAYIPNTAAEMLLQSHTMYFKEVRKLHRAKYTQKYARVRSNIVVRECRLSSL